MDMLQNLAIGFGGAATPINLGLCLIGCGIRGHRGAERHSHEADPPAGPVRVNLARGLTRRPDRRPWGELSRLSGMERYPGCGAEQLKVDRWQGGNSEWR